MFGKITCYLDCVSPYSYFALLYLEKNREALASHDVSVDIVPVFLGGINVGSGNKPPWTLEAKAKYGKYDAARAKRYFGCPKVQTPAFFPIVSLLPQRALVYIKSTYPDLFVQSFLQIFSEMWENGVDVQEVLEAANSPDCKKLLNENTKDALERGAFGCPWYLVRNASGEEEPFFGSDRFHFMWNFLGLPWKDLDLPIKDRLRAKI